MYKTLISSRRGWLVPKVLVSQSKDPWFKPYLVSSTSINNLGQKVDMRVVHNQLETITIAHDFLQNRQAKNEQIIIKTEM